MPIACETFLYVVFLLGVWLRLTCEWIAWAAGGTSAGPVWVEWALAVGAGLFLKRFFVLGYPTRRELGTGLLCFLPVGALAILRGPFPDIGFDTLHYHVYLQSRDYLRFAGDYLGGGGGTYLFPLGDRAFAVWRNLLGYRAGTLLNLACLLCLYRELTALFTETGSSTQRAWVAPLFAGLCLISEYVLICLGTYSVDILSLPLLLVLWRRFARENSSSAPVSESIALGVLAGLSVALKLTQIVFATVTVVALLRGAPKGKRARYCFVATVIGAVAVFPFLHFNWADSGNPIFPLANSVFKSTLYPAVTGGDIRWGPMQWWERFLFPIVMTFTPSRVSELGYYSGRLLLLFLLPFLGLARRKTYWVVVAAVFIWIQSSGYIRYGLWGEILVAVLALSALRDTTIPWRRWILAGLVGAQVFAAADLVLHRSDWCSRVLNASIGEWREQMARAFADLPGRGDPKILAARHFVNASEMGAFVVMANQHASLAYTHAWWRHTAPGAKERMLRSLEPLRGRSDVMTAFYPEELAEVRSALLDDGFELLGDGGPCFTSGERDLPFNLLCAPIASKPSKP